MKGYDETLHDNGNGHLSEKSGTMDGREHRNHSTGSFYQRLLARINSEGLANISETIRNNAGKIARDFDLSEQEEDLLSNMAFFEFEEGSSGNASLEEHLDFSDVQPLLAPDAPLREHRLVVAKKNLSEVRVPERIMNALLGIRCIDERLLDMTKKVQTTAILSHSREKFAHRIGGIIRNEKEGKSNGLPSGTVIGITGNDPGDLLGVASTALRQAGYDPRILRIRTILFHPDHELSFHRLWNRDCRIDPMAAIVQLSGEESPEEYGRIIELISALDSPVILLSSGSHDGNGQNFMSFSLPELEHIEQDELWEKSTASTEGKLKSSIYDLTNHFLLKPSDIMRISALALSEDPKAENVEAVASEIRREARKASRPPIRELAMLIEPVTTLQDLAVPETTQELLKEIIQRVKNNRKVLYDYGFRGKYQRGLATTALFYGESGTGKTHAAEAIAGELDLDLYRIDLSRVISKYIGETEKNLGRIFDGANNSGAVLLFDEADALFGKRSDVSDAHDRYANQEISYLLQKMEEYKGLSILTTNLANNMDPAFNRRITYRLGFPMTDTQTRKAIWERIFPAKAPLHNLNYAELAEELELTGAEIKNLALRAAYFAAANSEPIQMKHIRTVLKDELDKIGIMINDGDLSHWYRDGEQE